MPDSNTYIVQIDGREITVRIEKDCVVTVLDNRRYTVDWQEVAPDRLSLIIDGASYHLNVETVSDGTYVVTGRGKEYSVTIDDQRKKRLKELIAESERDAGPIDITSPMPGLVIEVDVGEGDTVETDQTLIVLEAMKMENEIRSSIRGKVEKIHVKTAQIVEKGQLLLTVRP
jgi:biotin carboxyl carrier protein